MMLNSSQQKGDFIDIKPIIKKGIQNWHIFLIMFLICGGVGILYYKFTKPTYKILANIIIQEDNESSMAGMQAAMMKNIPFGNLLGGNVKINDEIELIKSFNNFREVVKSLRLNEKYELVKFFRNKIYYQNSPIQLMPTIEVADTLETTLNFNINIDKTGTGIIKAYIGLFHTNIGEISFSKLPAIIKTDYGTFTLSATNFYELGKNYEMKVAYGGFNSAAEYYQEKVDVGFVSKKSDLIVLETEEQNKIKGKDLLNYLVNEYNKIGIKQTKDKASESINLLNTRINIIANELSDIEFEIEKYKKANDISDIEAEVKAIFENSGDLRSKQIDVEAQYNVIDLIEKFLLQPENRYTQIPYNVGLTDRNVLEGLQKYNDALLERMKLQKHTYDTNPMIEIYNEQLDAMRENMLTTIRSLKNGFEFTRNDLQKQESYFQSRLKNMPTQEREYINIKRQQYLKQELYMFLLQRREENILTQSLPTPKALLLDKAYQLSKPLKPRLSNSLFFSFGLAFFFSILWIYRKKKS